MAVAAADDSFPVKPARMVSDIRAALGDADIVFADTGAAKMLMARCYPTRLPNTCIVFNGLSIMAFALPGALAAKLAFPERQVLASMGDAAFLMNSQEIQTAVREKMPLAILIREDASYGLIKWKMDLELHEHEQVDPIIQTSWFMPKASEPKVCASSGLTSCCPHCRTRSHRRGLPW